MMYSSCLIQLGVENFLYLKGPTYAIPILEFLHYVKLELGAKLRGFYGVLSFRMFS